MYVTVQIETETSFRFTLFYPLLSHHRLATLYHATVTIHHGEMAVVGSKKREKKTAKPISRIQGKGRKSLLI